MVEIVMDGPGKNALGSGMMDFLQGRLEAADGAPVLLPAPATPSARASISGRWRASTTRGWSPSWSGSRPPAPPSSTTRAHRRRGQRPRHRRGPSSPCAATCASPATGAAPDRPQRGGHRPALPPAILRIVRHRHPRAPRRGAPRRRPPPAPGGGPGRPGRRRRRRLPAEARRRLDALAAHPPAAYAATKADLGRGVTAVDDVERRRFAEEVAPVWTSQATRDRVLAALGR